MILHYLIDGKKMDAYETILYIIMVRVSMKYQCFSERIYAI